MRHQFHRCANLRVIEVRASDLSHARKGGRGVVAELCNAKQLAPCLGLVECDWPDTFVISTRGFLSRSTI